MSAARHEFCEALTGLREALSLDPVANAAAGHGNASGATILRRGLLITGLVTLESFVRRRTDELLIELAAWPGSYNSLPEKLKYQALVEAPNRLHRYAKLLKREGEDFESEVTSELTRMARVAGPVFGFSRFVAGDYTGNLSEEGLRELLSSFLVKDIWNDFHALAVEIGFGAPSIQTLLSNIIQRRHKSAHNPSYVPAALDVQGLDENVLTVGICFDTALTSAVRLGLRGKWTEDQIDWRDGVDVFLLQKDGSKFRIEKPTSSRALRVTNNEADARTYIASRTGTNAKLVVTRDQAAKPSTWYIL